MGDFITRGGAKYPDTTPPPQWVCDVVPQEELARTKQHSIKRHTMETDPSAAAQRGGKYHIPGYCGYIPNRKDVAGRTFARETRRALNHDAKDIVIGDTIPSDPQSTHKPLVHDDRLRDTFIGKDTNRPRHLEGYTGHVPGVRDQPLGVTFGQFTQKIMAHPIDAKEDRKKLKSHPIAGFTISQERPKPKLTVREKGLNLKYNVG